MNPKLFKQFAINECSKIMLIDDDIMNIEILKEILKDDYNLKSATSGVEGLRKISEGFIPDLILLDVVMPNMDGYEVCKIIKKNDQFKDIPIIFLTAKMSTSDKVKAFKFGANDFITKPFEFEEILARIKTHISLKKASEQLNLYNEKLEEMLDKRQKELIKTEKQAGFSLLIQGIIHNLRGPLSVILGNINLITIMTDDVIAEKRKPSLKNIKKIDTFANKSMISCENLSKMIDSLMSKSRSDKSEELEIIDLNEIVKQEIEFLDADNRFKHRVKKEFNINTSELMVQVVPSEISQIFQNLIRNSLDALYKHENPKIIIYTTIIGKWTFLSIEDNAEGIAPEIIKNIFDPFFTTKPKKRTNDPEEPTGTGLGLHTCREIINSYNGDIKVISKVGKGTKFILSLPLFQESKQ